MSDLLKQLNEMEARHAVEIEEIREAIKKEGTPRDEIILGGMFIVNPDGDGWDLVDLCLMDDQINRLRAIENIIQAARKKPLDNIALYDAFEEAENLGLKF